MEDACRKKERARSRTRVVRWEGRLWCVRWKKPGVVQAREIWAAVEWRRGGGEGWRKGDMSTLGIVGIGEGGPMVGRWPRKWIELRLILFGFLVLRGERKGSACGRFEIIRTLGYLNRAMSLDNNARSKELRQIPTNFMHTCRPTLHLLLRL